MKIVWRPDADNLYLSSGSDNLALHRAPQDFALIRCFIGGASKEEFLKMDNPLLLQVVRKELEHLLQIKGTPVLEKIYRWDRAMPQYLLGHQERLKQIESRMEKQPGLFFAGNYLKGVGIPDCIQSGENAAKQVVHYLTHSQLNHK